MSRLYQITPEADIGHTREDLTNNPVKFWAVFSYLVIYDHEDATSRIGSL